MHKFQWLLNPRQVFDLTMEGGPKMGCVMINQLMIVMYSQISLNDHSCPLPISSHFVNKHFVSQSIHFYVLIFLLSDHLP